MADEKNNIPELTLSPDTAAEVVPQLTLTPRHRRRPRRRRPSRK